MTIDTAKELQMNIAKEGLALLVLHPTADVQLHRECISHIGTVWGIPTSDTQEVASLLEREQAAILAAGESGTVTHVLPEEELPMNASGLETLDNIWDLFETSLRVDSPYARTRLFEMAKWLEEYQNLLVRNNPDVDYDYFYDFLTNYEENVYAKVEANAAQ